MARLFKKSAVLSLFLLIFVSSGLMAQSTTGRIMGTIILDDGSRVPGVLIEAVSPRVVGKTAAVSDENGSYRLVNLPPGSYTLTFTLQGLQTVVQKGVDLVSEQTLTLNISMKTGEVTEQITVAGLATQIDVRSTTQGQNLTREIFKSLPKGRNFDSLMATIPGVQNEPLLGGISVDGASGLENVYYVDGVDTTNIVKGNSGQGVNFDFVEEVKVNSSGYSAEFGGSLGGVINVITRSGGNEFHGDLLGYYQGAPLRASYSDHLDLDRADPTGATAKYYSYNQLIGKDNDHRIEAGLNLGGYIIKDKLWFFGSFMPVLYSNTRSITHFNGNVSKDWKQNWDTWNWQVKLTTQLANNLRISASMVSNTSSFKGATGTGGGLPTATSNPNPTPSYNDIGFSLPNYSGALTLDWNIGNLQVNLRGGYFLRNLTDSLIFPSDTYYTFQVDNDYTIVGNEHMNIPDQYKRNVGFSQGMWPVADKKRVDEKMSVNGDFSYYLNLLGDHALKAGFQWTHQGQDYNAGAQFPIVYLAWDRDYIMYGKNYGRGTYGHFSVRGNADTGPYGNVYKAYANRWAIYFQDSWSITDRLTFNFGLRSEAEYIPSGYSSNPKYKDVRPFEWGFGDKIAPRLGFVWDINGDASTKISGSFGIFYDVCKLQIAASSFGGDKWVGAFYPLDTYEWDKIGKPGYVYPTPYAVFDFRSLSYDYTDHDMKAMSQRELTFGLEQRLTNDLAFKARLTHKSLLWAIEDIGIETPHGEDYYITNPGSDFIKARWVENKAIGTVPQSAPDIPKAKRNYWGATLSLEKRFSNNWMGGLSYTWSTLTGNYSGLASADEAGRTDPNVARYFDAWFLAFDKNLNPIDGPLPTDRTHVMKAYGTYNFDFGLSVGFTINGMTGTPVSTEYRLDYSGYMPFGRGDLGRTDFLTVADMNLNYDLKLGSKMITLMANIENLFNTRTAMTIYQRYNSTRAAVSHEQLASKNWEITDFPVLNDPLYNKGRWLYGDGWRGTPLRIRLGVKFSF